jgi:hypothetical protein
MWEPVAATATPKVACVAVVVAGALPTVSGTSPAPPAAVAKPAPAAAVPQHVTHMTRRTAIASPPFMTSLQADCADGTLDGAYTHAQLVTALARLGQDAHEYGDCHQAIVQAMTARSPLSK